MCTNHYPSKKKKRSNEMELGQSPSTYSHQNVSGILTNLSDLWAKLSLISVGPLCNQNSKRCDYNNPIKEAEAGRKRKLHFVSMATSQLVRTILDPTKNWFAAVHKKTITERLRKYGQNLFCLCVCVSVIRYAYTCDIVCI